MRIPHPGILLSLTSLCATAALLRAGPLHAQAPARTAPQSIAAESSSLEAAWVSKTLNFTYRGVTTHYTCDGLQQKLRRMLTMLGGRDVSVRGYGCINAYAPEPSPRVRIRMQVLEPADNRPNGGTVPAQWHWTDLLARRDPTEVSADCELVQQFRRSILPLFNPRSVDYRSTCVPRTAIPGTVRLRVEVLEPERRG